MKNASIVGIDLSKNVFQICMMNHAGKVLKQKKVKRDCVFKEIRELPDNCTVYMEACQSAHFWSREIAKLGKTVHQISPQFVKPYVKSQKNDSNDAEAICEAGSRGNMRFVPTKSEEQLELQAMQRIRERLMHDRTALINQARGILAEHGVVIDRSPSKLKRYLASGELKDVSETIKILVNDLKEELKSLESRIESIDKKLSERAKKSPVIKRLCTVPGIGNLTALSLIVVSGDPTEFKNGRQFAAYLGLVPRQVSTGGKTKLLGITKRGNTLTRLLLIHGSRAVVRAAVLKKKDDNYSLWVRKLHAKYGTNHTAVAVANKNARVAWRILTSNDEFDPAKLASDFQAQ